VRRHRLAITGLTKSASLDGRPQANGKRMTLMATAMPFISRG
jgi:hypothetical protein